MEGVEKMGYRTDIAAEACEKKGQLEGVRVTERDREGVTVTETEIFSDSAAEKLGKKKGRYVTLALEGLKTGAIDEEDAMELVAAELRPLICEGGVLVAGLGNRRMTPDALGPRAADGILATRHIAGALREFAGIENTRQVSVISTDVLGRTGIETCELIKGTVGQVKPSVVIAVDALSSLSVERLGTTVQISDSGIAPGSGVGNRRGELSRESLGVPVIAIGVPTVVDAATVAESYAGGFFAKRGFMVTPKEVDMLVDTSARVISGGINIALNPHLPIDDIMHALA